MGLMALGYKILFTLCLKITSVVFYARSILNRENLLFKGKNINIMNFSESKIHPIIIYH